MGQVSPLFALLFSNLVIPCGQWLVALVSTPPNRNYSIYKWFNLTSHFLNGKILPVLLQISYTIQSTLLLHIDSPFRSVLSYFMDPKLTWYNNPFWQWFGSQLVFQGENYTNLAWGRHYRLPILRVKGLVNAVPSCLSDIKEHKVRNCNELVAWV